MENNVTSQAFKDICARDMARPPLQRRPMDTIALLTDADAEARNLQGYRNVFSKDQFCEFVTNVDAASSACGTATL